MDRLKYEYVKTRKPHICHGCNLFYQKGTDMYYYVQIDNGDFFTMYLCGTCEGYIYTLPYDELADEFPIGSLLYYDDYPVKEYDENKLNEGKNG